MWAIWSILTERWVGQYASEKRKNGTYEWLAVVYPSRSTAEKDLRAITIDAKDRATYEIRKYDGSNRTVDETIIPIGEKTVNAKYKVRTKRIDDGGYVLSYGRGKKKLTVQLRRDEHGYWQLHPWDRGKPIGGFTMKREAQEAWGVWAEAEYDEARKQRPVEPIAPPPPSFKRSTPSLPPAFKKNIAPPWHQPSKGWGVESRTDIDEGNPYLADFLDPDMYEHAPGHGHKILPIGALVEVFNWMQANIPFDQHLLYPWVNVRRALIRRYPKDKRFQETPS